MFNIHNERNGSPNWLEHRTFTFIVSLENMKPRKEQVVHSYRIPIYLAQEYKRMIDSGKAKNESDLARQIGVSRVHVNHFITLLKLAPEIIRLVEEMSDPMPQRYISERKLRSIAKLPSEKQRAIMEALSPLVSR